MLLTRKQKGLNMIAKLCIGHFSLIIITCLSVKIYLIKHVCAKHCLLDSWYPWKLIVYQQRYRPSDSNTNVDRHLPSDSNTNVDMYRSSDSNTNVDRYRPSDSNTNVDMYRPSDSNTNVDIKFSARLVSWIVFIQYARSTNI